MLIPAWMHQLCKVYDKVAFAPAVSRGAREQGRPSSVVRALSRFANFRAISLQMRS
jgi:hypothetical protein